jgi:integral membrane sensor domain MASE1
MLATALLAHYHAAWPVALLMASLGMITVISLLFTHETVARRAR